VHWPNPLTETAFTLIRVRQWSEGKKSGALTDSTRSFAGMYVVRISPSVGNDFESDKSVEAGVMANFVAGSGIRSKVGFKPEEVIEKTRYEASGWILIRTGLRILFGNLARREPLNFQWWTEGSATAVISTSLDDISRDPNQLRATTGSAAEAREPRFMDGATDGRVEPTALRLSVDLN